MASEYCCVIHFRLQRCKETYTYTTVHAVIYNLRLHQCVKADITKHNSKHVVVHMLMKHRVHHGHSTESLVARLW